ncbi:hypothetical protein P3X46_032905 [Hevea brasiliensis]|uniref:Transmembrane protein 214-A n=1 Tax=Hevea brasiliensis TaxID=3981 RepID=A0ABQ9KER3_HEVBR|nr:uncharacterized protein LOC110670112 isoform X2 [Hevea brasiliensis]KAJ9135760.1 hypothetical protein P3X46_032905 [Hevea brasiliensis]
MESFESNLIKEDQQITNTHITNNADHGWQKVIYSKRQRKQKPTDSDSSAANAGKINGTAVPNDKSNVFRSLEQQSEERRRRIIESQRDAIAAVEAPVRSKHRSDDEDENEDDSDDAAPSKGNEKMEEKKVKQKKPKKPKVTLAEAAAKIDSADLAAFLADISASYEEQQEILLMRFADYFGRAFSAVSSAQFPWVKLFRENTVSKMTDIPLSHISDAVYKTSVDWINQRSIEALGSFVLWSLDSILADLASQQVGSKAAKKGVQHVSSKSQVAIFVVLAMVLRRKPDALLNVLPTLRESSKYQGQDKLPIVAWMIAQVCQGDLTVGLYSWAHSLLPIVSSKSSNPQSRDIILQLVEKILSSTKARTILVSGAVRKGERLVPPFAFEILLRVTFPASSATVKATERFKAVYPTLREVALAGSTGSKAMKQVSLQILSFAIKAAGESNPELSKEAAGICIWCLTQNAECYKHWDKVYQENLEASIAILKKLSEEWKEVSVKLASLDPLRETIKNFRQKNEKALAKTEYAAHHAFYRDADKYCKLILGKLSHGHCCAKSLAFAVIALAVGAVFLSPNMESLDWKKLVVVVNSQFSP